MFRHVLAGVILACSATCLAQGSFVNWESPYVHPLDITPDGQTLLAVNTPDNRLEVFDVSSGAPVAIGAVPVGLDPVSVRARTNGEAWVVNHVSDSISIVDLTSMNVVQTIATGDEPADVIFAGAPQRAFVSVSQLNQVRVYDPAAPLATPVILDIEGEDPRALATDGVRVFAAVFESGNRTTIVSQQLASSGVNPYAGNQNPPPNDGALFNPPIAAGLPTPPEVGIIVRKALNGSWRDDNNGNWSPAVTWDLHDYDVAMIDVTSLAVTYVTRLMNLNMAIAVRPDGSVTVVGTNAINHIRFEPNLNGIFVRAKLATFDPATASIISNNDLNPHLDYLTPTVPQNERDQSLGDPRGIAWSSDGARGYVSGMGSNNVIVIDPNSARLNRIEVGHGPTGLVLDETQSRLYVLNKFDATISTIDTSTSAELLQTPFYDPTPATIRTGRPHLYDSHATSGLGHVSCGSCHVDGRMDQLAWDLGDPAGEVKPFNQLCNGGIPGGGVCEDWHPMKGPMATQTLIGIIGTEPLHWRGDREGLGAFNHAFVTLLGDDAELTPTEMDEFEAFIGTLTTPPNPNRNFDDTLPASFANGGNPVTGENLFTNVQLDGGLVTCEQCHTFPTGSSPLIISGNLLADTQSIKVPQLRNMYEKTGFQQSSLANNRGFGFIKDGSIDTMLSFLQFPGFNFAAGAAGNQQRRDVEAFLFCFPTATHAAVGTQTTLVDGAASDPNAIALVNDMMLLADSGAVGVVARGRRLGEARGYAYVGAGVFQSDRSAETATLAALQSAIAPGSEMTFTVVPLGSQTRIGIDRDEDGFFDSDERDACADPADPASTPDNSGGCTPCIGDVNGNGVVDLTDLATLLSNFGLTEGALPEDGDVDGDADVDLTDLAIVLSNFDTVCG